MPVFPLHDPSLPPPQLHTLLVAFDQTNQDPATLAAAAEIALRSSHTDLAAFTAFAYKGAREPRREEYLDSQTAALELTAGIPTSRLPEEDSPSDPHLEPHGQILGWALDKSADLIVISSPYLDDYWKLGRGSTTIHLPALLAHSRKPLFIIREPPKKGDPALPADVLFPLSPNSHSHTGAASWALHLVRPEATIQILAVLPNTREAPEALASLIGKDSDLNELSAPVIGALAEVAAPDFPDLLTALGAGATAKRSRCILSIRSGDFVKAAISAVTGTVYPKIRPLGAPIHRAITVLACPSNPGSQNHQLCIDLIQNLSGPALISIDS